MDGFSLLSALWFFLPAGLANMSPLLASKLPVIRNWKVPLDFGKSYKGKRIFGENKTWRGLVTGMIAATIVIAFQKYYFTHNLWALEHSVFDYRPGHVWLLGPLFGFGALLGDAVESFFKRRNHVEPGKSWFPFDQIDYILGGLIFAAPVVDLSLTLVVYVFVSYFGLHLVVSYIGYLIGAKDKPI